MRKIIDLTEYFGRSDWELDPKALRFSKCVIIYQVNKQVSSLDSSTNISQPLVNSLIL